MYEKVEQINVEDIIPNRFQPRLVFDENELNQLAASIKTHGVIQPLVLRKLGNKYEIIAGERRFKASKIAGLKKVPALIRELTDNESAEIALIENLQRKNLSSIEVAQSYNSLLKNGYFSQEKLAENLGISESMISDKLKLLNLCNEVQNALLNNKISERHARSLLAIQDPEQQKMLLNKIITERLTVQQLDTEIKKLNGEYKKESDIMNNKLDTSTNIFGIQVNSENEMEGTAPKLDVSTEPEPESMGFNPFTQKMEGESNTVDNTNNNAGDDFEVFDMFGDAVDPNENNNDISVKPNLGDQINQIRDAVNLIKENGFNVEMEEYDLEDIYQINIKIKKEIKE